MSLMGHSVLVGHMKGDNLEGNTCIRYMYSHNRLRIRLDKFKWFLKQGGCVSGSSAVAENNLPFPPSPWQLEILKLVF